MRSRDGNRSYLYAVLSLILTFSTLYGGEEYLISYRYSTQNSVLFNDSLDIAKAMTTCGDTSYGEKLTIELQENSHNLKKTILRNLDLFYLFINKIGLHVRNDEKIQNGISSSMITVTLKPTCFTVEFNENSVTLTPLK